MYYYRSHDEKYHETREGEDYWEVTSFYNRRRHGRAYSPTQPIIRVEFFFYNFNTRKYSYTFC